MGRATNRTGYPPMANTRTHGCRPTEASWGYTIVTQAQYNSAFGTAWSLTPQIAFSHDVAGNSPAPLSDFRDDTMSINLGITASYQNQWRAQLSYTNNFGSPTHSGVIDQDYVAFNVSYSF